MKTLATVKDLLDLESMIFGRELAEATTTFGPSLKYTEYDKIYKYNGKYYRAYKYLHKELGIHVPDPNYFMVLELGDLSNVFNKLGESNVTFGGVYAPPVQSLIATGLPQANSPDVVNHYEMTMYDLCSDYDYNAKEKADTLNETNLMSDNINDLISDIPASDQYYDTTGTKASLEVYSIQEDDETKYLTTYGERIEPSRIGNYKKIIYPGNILTRFDRNHVPRELEAGVDAFKRDEYFYPWKSIRKVIKEGVIK